MRIVLNIIAAAMLAVLPVCSPCVCAGFSLICGCGPHVAQADGEKPDPRAETQDNAPADSDCCCHCPKSDAAKPSQSAPEQPTPPVVPCRGKAKLIPTHATLTVAATPAAQTIVFLPLHPAAPSFAPTFISLPAPVVIRAPDPNASPPPTGLLIAATCRLIL